MKRRHFISSMGLIIPATVIGGEFLFSSCNQVGGEVFDFSVGDIEMLNEIAETIIPATLESPGAKAAKVGEFIKVYVSDCYTTEDQSIFKSGMTAFKELCKREYGKEFVNLDSNQKRHLLIRLEEEVKRPVNTNKNEAVANGDAVQTGKAQEVRNRINSGKKHYYTMIKELTVFGYFTSEPGATRALRYTQTPGYYQGEVAYKKGDKAWAT